MSRDWALQIRCAFTFGGDVVPVRAREGLVDPFVYGALRIHTLCLCSAQQPGLQVELLSVRRQVRTSAQASRPDHAICTLLIKPFDSAVIHVAVGETDAVA